MLHITLATYIRLSIITQSRLALGWQWCLVISEGLMGVGLGLVVGFDAFVAGFQHVMDYIMINGG